MSLTARLNSAQHALIGLPSQGLPEVLPGECYTKGQEWVNEVLSVWSGQVTSHLRSVPGLTRVRKSPP